MAVIHTNHIRSRKRYPHQVSSGMLDDLKWEAKHHALNQAYLQCQLESEDLPGAISKVSNQHLAVRAALEDDVDTPTAMRHLK